MVDIKRGISSGCEVFSIKNNSGNLKLFNFYDNDLRFTCDELEKSDSYNIEIGLGDSYFYTLIDEVYDAVSNHQPFKYLKNDFEAKDLVFLEKVSNSKRLFKDGVIEWHSDDCAYNIGSVLYITKENDKYIMTFQKSKVHLDRVDPFTNFTVTIGNNSRYNPYNITFMNMFNKLRDYDFLINQVSISNYVPKEKVNVRKKQ